MRGGRTSADLAERLGINPKLLASDTHRARRRFSVLLAAELRQTVADDEIFEQEWECLRRYAPWLEEPTGDQ